MKTILLISSRFPYPPIGGDKLKNHFLIQILKKKYKLHFVCISNISENNEMREYCLNNFEEYKIFYKSKFDHGLAILKDLCSSNPLQVSYYFFQDIKKYISIKAKECDLVINTLIRTSEYVLDLEKKKILDIVDSIGLNYQFSQKNTKSLFWKTIYKVETSRLLKYEKECIEKYDYSIFVNHDESQHYKGYGKVAWIPNGVDDRLLTYNLQDSKYKNCIVFCGKMDYQPNIDAILWFINNVFDDLSREIKLLIVGSHPSKKIRHLASDRILITGYVQDPYLYINSALLSIAPMQTGGGIQNKILESMALGKIVITSNHGAKPIIGSSPFNLLVYKNAKHLSMIINKIFNNPAPYQQIGVEARKFIASKFTWKHYEEKLDTIIREVMDL